MLIKIIKKIFGIKEKEIEVITFKEKQRKKVRYKAGTEEWLKYADDFTQQAYYASLAQKDNTKKAELEKKDFDSKNKRVIAFEMVPKQQSNRNVRSYLEYMNGNFEQWAFIRKNEEEKAGCKCIVCGGTSKDLGKLFNTECHEVWNYDFKNKKQTLISLQALCTLCHNIKHIDQHCSDKEKFDNLLQMYVLLNDITLEQANIDYDKNLNLRKSVDNVLFNSINMSILHKEYDIAEEDFKCHSNEFNHFINNVFKKKNNKKDIKNEET